MSLVVTIDGPSGSGKSTVAGLLAKRLGWRRLDTGAMFRTVTLAALKQGVDLSNTMALAKLAESLHAEFGPDKVTLDGVDVSKAIRDAEVARSSYHAAENPRVRETLLGWQREFASAHPTVAEGRDQGTVVFPDAFCKIFLTADPVVRAKRRYEEFLKEGKNVDFDQVLRDQEARDIRDRERIIAPLRQAEDAVTVDTSQLDIEQVVELLERLVRERLTEGPKGR